MKTRFKHLSRSSISVLLALLMVVSTVMVGVITTTAAYVDDEQVGVSDALTANSTFYLQLDTTNGWGQDSPTIKIEWHYNYNNGSGDKHSDGGSMTSLGNGLYSATVPNNNYIRAVKVNRYSTDGNTYWNHYGWGVASERSSNDNNELTISGWNDGKSSAWSTYTPPNPQTVNYGVHSSGHGTLSVSPATSTGASGGTINSGTSVTFTASPSSGYAVEGWYSNSGCTTAISGASGSTYTTTISGTTNVYVKFTESSWPPIDLTGYSNDDGTCQINVSTDNAVSVNVSYYTGDNSSNDYKLKKKGNKYWISLASGDITKAHNNSNMYYSFTSNKTDGDYGKNSIPTSATVNVDASFNYAVSDSGAQGNHLGTNTEHKFARVSTNATNRSNIDNIGVLYDSSNNTYTIYYYSASAVSSSNVYFKGLGNTWSSNGRPGTQVGNTAEYTYVVTAGDIVNGSKGDAFYFRVVYSGTEYAPQNGSDVLLTEGTTVTTTNSSNVNGAFYFPGSAVGATIHASLTNSTLSVWYTPAHVTSDGYYVVGRFKVKDSGGTEYYTKDGSDGSWATYPDSDSAKSARFKFTQTSTSTTDGVTTTLYELHTNETLGALSPFRYGSEDHLTPYVFVVYDQNYHFGESTNSGKGIYFINHRAETSAMSLRKVDRLTENNELDFEDRDNQNGTVVLHLKVSGTAAEIDQGTAAYSIWYTMEGDKTYAVDGAKLTASPSMVAQGGTVKLTATYTTANSDTTALRYTFQKYINDSSSPNFLTYQTITGAEDLTTNVYNYTENDVGTNMYRVLISSVTQENLADKYYSRAALTSGLSYVADLYMSNPIASNPDETTWDNTRLKNLTLYTRTTSASYTKSNPYEFALSTVSGAFDVNAPSFTLNGVYNNDDVGERCQNCKIEYNTQVVTIDGVETAVRTYKVIPNTKCSNPTIYLDVEHKDIYAVCTYDGATETKTSSYDSSELVTYYFAEDADHVDDTNASTSAHQSTGGTGKGMRIRYWNASVQEGGTNDYMGQADVYEQAKVRKSDGTYTTNEIYVNMSELYAQNVSGIKKFYVYKVQLPVRATSFSFINSSGNPIPGGFLNSIDITSTVASNTLNPNRIYLFYWGSGPASNAANDYISFKGIILDDHLWTTNTSSNATNEVSIKKVDATLIDYTNITGNPRDNLQDKEVNKAALSAYTAKGTPHALYFGDFTSYGSLTGYSNYVHWKNVAQHNNSKSYFAVVKDLVGMTLSKTQVNANGYPLLMDTQGNNANGISDAKPQPLFDYANVTTADSNSKKIAQTARQGLHFPMNKSSYNGITTYSYDSTTDYNRIWDTVSDFTIQGNMGTNTAGYRNKYAYGHDGTGKGDTGFFPFGGNTDQVSGTGFGTEFDLKFYMTNTGYLTENDGSTNEDIAFNFSGDDDVWVYVDGVKVLDLGGAHKTAAATINFTDMRVYYKVAGNSTNATGTKAITSTTDAWASNDDYVVTVDLKELMEAYGKDFNPKDATKQHTLQMFYMERGTYESNCSLSYNLPQASGLNIKNSVTADHVNLALQKIALYSANPDYFTYQVSAKQASGDTPVITNTPAPNTRGDLSNVLPQYPYNYETFYTYDDGVNDPVSYKLSKAHSETTAGGTLPSYSTSSYTNAGDVVYALSGNVTATTEGKAFPTGKTASDGTFYLLNNQMANFDSKIPANSYVIVAQKQDLGETAVGSDGLLAFSPVGNNNVGNYYLTSYTVYDEKSKSYIVGSESNPIELALKYADNDTYYAADTTHNLGETNANAFYFSNYSGSTDDLASAMTVNFINDIAVGDIVIEKRLAENTVSNTLFKFDIEFCGVFGDDSDSTWATYDGLEYWVYNDNDDLVYPTAQYYTARTGIQLRVGEHAVIKGIPVETRYRVTERTAVGFSFNKYEMNTYKNANNAEISVTYGGDTYQFKDSNVIAGNNSPTTDSDTELFTETISGHSFTYYKEMIPPVSKTQVTTGDRTNYGATAKLVYTNSKENIVITFKYYDRDTTNNQPAAIEETATEYRYKFDNLEAYTYYKGVNDDQMSSDLKTKWAKPASPQANVKYYEDIDVGDFICIDFAKIIQEKAITFGSDVSLQNLLDEYYLWTTQAAAVTAMQTKDNLHEDYNGGTKYSAAQSVYHTKSDGTPNTAGEKWVTYYNGKGIEVDAESFWCNAQTNFDSVKSIVVWLYNEPKSYDVNVYGVKDDNSGNFDATNYVHLATNPKVDGAYVANCTGVNFQKHSTTAYYSQRVGRTLNDPEYLDALAYMKAYGFSGVVSDFRPQSMTDASITINPNSADPQQLAFAYWSYNSDGSTVASTEWSYGYRITNNVNLYAVYAPTVMASSTVGLTITQDKDDNYVDVDQEGNGTARTRLNVMFTPYNCPDYDQNIKYAGLVNIYVTNLVKQLKAETPSITEAQIRTTIEGLQSQYANQLKTLLNTNKASFTAKLLYGESPAIELTTKGYVYNALGSGTGSVQLTNKNRVQFTTDFKTSALYPATGANHNNVGILQIGVMCYDTDNSITVNDWVLSDNCIVRLFTDEND